MSIKPLPPRAADEPIAWPCTLLPRPHRPSPRRGVLVRRAFGLFSRSRCTIPHTEARGARASHRGLEYRAPAPYWRDPRAWRLLRPRWRRSRPFPRIRPYYRRVPSTSFWARKPRMAPLKAPNGDLNAQKVSLGRFSSKQPKTKKRMHATRVEGRDVRTWGNYGAQISARLGPRLERVERNHFRPK